MSDARTQGGESTVCVNCDHEEEDTSIIGIPTPILFMVVGVCVLFIVAVVLLSSERCEALRRCVVRAVRKRFASCLPSMRNASVSPLDEGDSKSLKDDLGVAATDESLRDRKVDDKGSLVWDSPAEDNLADHASSLNSGRKLVAEPQAKLQKIVEQGIQDTKLAKDSQSCEGALSQSSVVGGEHTNSDNANTTSVAVALESSMVSVEGNTILLPQPQEHISTVEEPKSHESTLLPQAQELISTAEEPKSKESVMLPQAQEHISPTAEEPKSKESGVREVYVEEPKCKESGATVADATSKLTRKPRTLPALHHQPEISKLHARASEELDAGILRPRMGNGNWKRSTSIDLSETAEGQALVDGSTVVLWKGSSRAAPTTLE